MYNASEQFHNAVYENSPVERVLFEFPDSTIFTNEDIHMASGIKFMEAANLEEDLKIGACPASSIETTIMNYHGLLTGYTFGECTVSLSARTFLTSQDASDANCTTVFRYGTDIPLKIEGFLTEPYLKINDNTPTAQPPFPVYSVLTVGDILYCISIDGEVWAGQWTDGALWLDIGVHTWDSISTQQWNDIQGVLVPLVDNVDWASQNQKIWDDLVTTSWQMFSPFIEFNAFMVNKFKGWAANHRGMSYNAGQLYEFYTDGKIEGFEYVKLGVFRFNTPKKRKVDMISVQAYDRMTNFDIDAQAFWDGLTYPITLGQMFERLCNYVGVNRATVSFINSMRSFSKAPLKTEGVTAKEVLGWIAEAACSFARMTRDGEIELAWFSEKPVSLPMTSYFSIDVAEYSVAQIDKLQILGVENDIGVIIGPGTNGYQILDNPCLYGTSDTEIRTYGVPIYNRLNAFESFSPVMATAVCDWSVQAGDIISIVLNGVSYQFPIYCQTITWNGAARVSYESTGAEKRPVMDKVNRRIFEQNRSMFEITATVDGLTLDVSNGDTSSTLTLRSGSTELSSKDIRFNGMVSFNNLNDGVTTISGSNIKTGTVSASRLDVDNLYVRHLEGADGTFTGTLQGVNGTFSGILTAASGTFSGSLSAADGTFTNLTGTGYVALGGLVTIDTEGLTLLGPTDSVRIFMNPPTASGGSEARWVSRGGYYSLGIYTSRREDKTDVVDISDECSEIIDKLHPVYFRFKGDATEGNRSVGFIAEETDLACKEITSYLSDGKPGGVQYSNITALLVAELQRLRKRVETLERKIA